MEYLHATDIQQDRSRQQQQFCSLALNDSFPFFRCRHYQWAVWWGWQVLCRGRNMLFFYVPLAPTPYYCLFLISLAPNMSKIWLVHMAFQLFPCRNSCLTSQIKPMPMFFLSLNNYIYKNGSCFNLFFKMNLYSMFQVFALGELIHKNRS